MSIEITRQLQGDEVVSKTDADNTYLTLNTPQTLTGSKTFNVDTNIANTRKLIFKGSRDWNIENNNGFTNINNSWGILFDNTRNSSKTSILTDHIETPYINIGSGNSSSYRLDKNGEDLRWNNKPIATKEYVDNKFDDTTINNSLTIRFRNDKIFDISHDSVKTNFLVRSGDTQYQYSLANSGSPSSDSDLTTKKYVDNLLIKKKVIPFSRFGKVNISDHSGYYNTTYNNNTGISGDIISIKLDVTSNANSIQVGFSQAGVWLDLYIAGNRGFENTIRNIVIYYI